MHGNRPDCPSTTVCEWMWHDGYGWDQSITEFSLLTTFAPYSSTDKYQSHLSFDYFLFVSLCRESVYFILVLKEICSPSENMYFLFTPFYSQIKISHTQIKISHIQIKISHIQFKISHIQIKISHNQIKISHIQIKISHIQIKMFNWIFIYIYNLLQMRDELSACVMGNWCACSAFFILSYWRRFCVFMHYVMPTFIVFRRLCHWHLSCIFFPKVGHN